jgi:hypothetical protein
MQRKSLSDILRAGDREALSQAWNSTEAAAEFVPLPAATYECHIIHGEACTSQRGTPGYKLVFKVLDGNFAGRQVWHELWLTPAALPMTKRDLGKLGITSLEQLDRPLPRGIRCRVNVVSRKADDGSEYNRIRSFDFIGIDVPQPDPFAPLPAASANGQPPNGKPPTTIAGPAEEPGDAAGPEGEADTSFNPDSFSSEGGTQ